MTRFPLRRLRLRPGEEHREEVLVELEPFVLGGERYLPVRSEVPAELTISRATSGDVYRLRFAARLHGVCMRCLADAVLELDLSGSEYHANNPGDEEELRSEYVAEDQLELAAWARDLIAVALPDQILCRPECAGLCPACGKDLNVEPHEHPDESIDPRWEALDRLRDGL